MKRAIIFYQSQTGTTQRYAQEIGEYLQSNKIDTLWLPIEKCNDDLIKNIDYLFLGCWTKGLMVFFQKPDEIWNYNARKITIPSNTKVALFATYKIRTGSMFKNMGKQLKKKNDVLLPNLSSRNGKLTDKDISIIHALINN